MSITIRYFALLRERMGAEREELALEDLAAPTVAALFATLAERVPALEAMRPHLRAAVNHEFVGYEHELSDGDEVAFIPPVSGGAHAEDEEAASSDGRFLVTRRAIDAPTVSAIVRRPDAGAVVTFEGVVRNHTDDHDVSHLEYDAYVDMALRKLVEVSEEARQRWPDIEVAVHHRWGRLEIEDVAVVIAVSSAHRAEAFEASRYVIDRLKEVVPIWKKEVGPDGSEWVGTGP